MNETTLFRTVHTRRARSQALAGKGTKARGNIWTELTQAADQLEMTRMN